MRTPVLLLIQLVLVAMLAYDLWNRASTGAELPLVSILAMGGIAILAVMTGMRLLRERAAR